MKINMLCKTLLLAGLTAAMLTGCGKSGIPAETEVPAAAREQELSEAKQDIIEVVQADTGAETAAAKTSAAVSYTHLDVYKRQIMVRMFPSRWSWLCTISVIKQKMRIWSLLKSIKY